LVPLSCPSQLVASKRINHDDAQCHKHTPTRLHTLPYFPTHPRKPSSPSRLSDNHILIILLSISFPLPSSANLISTLYPLFHIAHNHPSYIFFPNHTRSLLAFSLYRSPSLCTTLFTPALRSLPLHASTDTKAQSLTPPASITGSSLLLVPLPYTHDPRFIIPNELQPAASCPGSP
jgi:hypothetical protein